MADQNKESFRGIESSKFEGAFFVVLFIVYMLLCLKTAWVCDDAFITFRTVDNFIQGFGLTWNVAERVQTFTHPLWFLVLSGGNFFSGELYYTAIFLSLLCSFLVFFLIWRWRGENWQAAALALGILTFSKSYLEYSTSGLENSLTHLLVGGFILYYFRVDKKPLAVFWLSLIAGLGLLNRMDLMLFFLWPLALFFYQNRSWKNFGWIIAGFLPVVAWEIFSLIYYGFLFPNTAYAKMICTGVGHSELIRQGWYYIINGLRFDPIAILAIITGIFSPWLMRKTLWPFALGLTIYLIYIIYIGGDFMAGRFLTVPLCISVFLISQMPLQSLRFSSGWLWLLLFLLGLLPAGSPVRSDFLYGEGKTVFCDEHHIYDERLQYYPKTGLFAPHRWDFYIFRNSRVPQPPFAVEERVGMKGYLAGPKVHLLDYLALGDPLLARMPAIRLPGPQSFHIAHFYRCIPDGYIESLINRDNRIKDHSLAAYYDKLRIITRGKLFSQRRAIEIMKMNLGYYDSLIQRELYRSPPLQVKKSREVRISDDGERIWFDPSNVHFSLQGVAVDFENETHSANLVVFLDQYGNYEVNLYRGNNEVCLMNIGNNWKESLLLKQYTLSIPEAVWKAGYTRLLIKPIRFSNRHTMGGIAYQ